MIAALVRFAPFSVLEGQRNHIVPSEAFMAPVLAAHCARSGNFIENGSLEQELLV